MRKILMVLALFALTGVMALIAEDYDDLFTFRTLEEYQPVADGWAKAYMAKAPKLKVQSEVVEADEFVDKIDNEMFTIGPMLPAGVVDRLESSVSPTVHIEIFSKGSKPIFAWADDIMLSQNKLLRNGLEIMLSDEGQSIAKDEGYKPLSLARLNEQRKAWKLKELTKDQYKY